MSARKGSDTKIPEDTSTDSGFLSGEQLFSGELKCDDVEKSDSDKVQSSSVVHVNIDSGLCLEDSLSNLSLDTPTEQVQPQRTQTDKIPNTAILNWLLQQDEDGDS